MRGRGQRGDGERNFVAIVLSEKKIDIFNRCAVRRPVFEKLHACKAVEWRIIRMWSGAFGKLPLQVKVHVRGRGFLGGSNGARVGMIFRCYDKLAALDAPSASDLFRPTS